MAGGPGIEPGFTEPKSQTTPKRLTVTECHRVAYFLDLEQFLCSRCVMECDRDRSRIGSKTGSEPGVKPGSGETPTFLLPTRSPFPARTLTDLPPKNRSPRYVIWTPSPTSPSFDENLFLPHGVSLDFSVTEVHIFLSEHLP